MPDTKKQNEIKVLAKYLRQSLGNVTDLKLAVKELFKGEAEFSIDYDEQIVIYTGHTFDRESPNKRVYSVSCIEHLSD
jgi:hypothetical protein